MNSWKTYRYQRMLTSLFSFSISLYFFQYVDEGVGRFVDPVHHSPMTQWG